MGLLTKDLMSELKKTKRDNRKKEQAAKAVEGGEEGEEGEEDVVQEVNEDNQEQEEMLNEGNMPGRVGGRNQLQELQALGFGSRSFGYASPYKGRKNGVTARMQASAENRTAQITYELQGKSCQKCKKQFRDGAKLKSKVIRCENCFEFVHEKTNTCKVDLARGNPSSYTCPPCTEGLKSGTLFLKDLFSNR